MTSRKTRQGLSAGSHDHRHCISSALAAAESRCAALGAQLTPIRRRVLELVWSSHVPIGAYDILAKLAAETGKVQPPTVYRALDFLKAKGLIHRIESRNAFIGCAQPDEKHAGQFLLCRACGDAAELSADRALAALERQAVALGYRIEHRTIELEGLCPQCQDGEAA
jgi:Fur family transcriptional regulator, zinc uptake regulator